MKQQTAPGLRPGCKTGGNARPSGLQGFRYVSSSLVSMGKSPSPTGTSILGPKSCSAPVNQLTAFRFCNVSGSLAILYALISDVHAKSVTEQEQTRHQTNIPPTLNFSPWTRYDRNSVCVMTKTFRAFAALTSMRDRTTLALNVAIRSERAAHPNSGVSRL